MGGVESICLGRISTWGLNCQRSEQTECLCEAFTGSRGLAPWRGLQGGNVPCLRRKLHFASQICIISGPFWSEFQKYYDFWWSQGAVLLFLKECVFRNHKCTILVPFLSKFIRRPIYNFGGRKGAVPPCLRKFCILRAKLHHFRPFLSKFTEISGGCKGASLLFIRECVFWRAINAQFQSLFCQNLYIYDLGGCTGAVPPCPRKFWIWWAKYA